MSDKEVPHRARRPDQENATDAEVVSTSAANQFELIDPDVRLMMEVKAGSAVAFEQLVRRYQKRIIAFLCQFVPADRAEDLAQDVFLRVYRARDSYKPGARFSTWIYTIAHNLASNSRRKFSNRKEFQTPGNVTDSGRMTTIESMVTAPSGQMPVRQMDKMELSEVVATAMQTLNERQRMAVFLNKFEGLGYAEIGEMMELTEKAVKSLLSRARANLRDVLKPYLDSGTLPGAGMVPVDDPDDSEKEQDE